MKDRLTGAIDALLALVLAAVFIYVCYGYIAGERQTEAKPIDDMSIVEFLRYGSVDVNTASAAQLEALPGIGKVIAGGMIEYRDGHGGFAELTELMSVRYIGETRYALLERYLYIE